MVTTTEPKIVTASKYPATNCSELIPDCFGRSEIKPLPVKRGRGELVIDACAPPARLAGSFSAAASLRKFVNAARHFFAQFARGKTQLSASPTACIARFGQRAWELAVDDRPGAMYLNPC